MHIVWDSHPLKPPSSQATRKSKELWTKNPEWNNVAYEEKEKYHYFTYPEEDHTNFHPISTKEKEWGREKKRRPTKGARKSKQRKKIGGKLKESKIINPLLETMTN